MLDEIITIVREQSGVQPAILTTLQLLLAAVSASRSSSQNALVEAMEAYQKSVSAGTSPSVLTFGFQPAQGITRKPTFSSSGAVKTEVNPKGPATETDTNA
jgi:hypothetical protein